MTKNRLKCFLFNDLEPWERRSVEALLEEISTRISVETIWVTESQRRFFHFTGEGQYWIVAKNWQRALHFLSSKRFKSGKLYVSVLDVNQHKSSLYGLSFQSILSRSSKSLTFLVHSPMEYRFLRDIKKVPQEQVQLLPLPFYRSSRSYQRKNSDEFRLGTLCQFDTESNIPFAIAVSHFIKQCAPQVRMDIMGRGPLYNHFAKMVNELEIGEMTNVVETVSDFDISQWDLFLYFPLRNAHFIPVMLAAASKVPVLSVDIPGIEKFITSGKNGVVLSSYEIKSMGEKIIELMNNPFQRKTMAENLWNDLREKYSLETISEQYYRLFFKTSSISDWKEAA